MADPEPTTWELMRILQTVQETLGRMEGRMVTQDALKTYQDSNERRFAQVEQNHTNWTVESRGAHTALDGKIDAQNVAFRALFDNYREKQEALERASREGRSRTWLAIGVSILGAVLSVGGALIVYAATTGGV